MLLIDPAFRPRIAHLDLEAIEASADPTYAVDHDFVIRAVNSAYLEFGRANGHPEVAHDHALGCPLFAAMDPPAREFYVRTYLQVLQGGEPFHQDYECSSPAVYRRFRLSAYPLPAHGGLLISNHLAFESPVQRDPVPVGGAHRTRDGLIIQCCHCRKVQNQVAPNTWDWVPDLVAERHLDVSHSLCPACLAHYYPELSESA
jgi:hypothetical protein